MSAGRLLRTCAIAAVLAVAAVAAWVSYLHALIVVREAGQAGAVVYAYPALTDGLIFMASMALLDAARRKAAAPPLARWLLALGIAGTAFANVYSGLSCGALGAAVAAWPAVVFVGSYELLILIIRARPGTRVPTIRALKEACGVGQPAAERFQAYLSNGHEAARG
jgi:hypothetical protein